MLKARIEARHSTAKKDFLGKHPHAQKFFQQKGISLENIRQYSTKLLTAGTLTSALMLGLPNQMDLKIPSLPIGWVKTLTEAGLTLPENPRAFLASQLKDILPEIVCPLTAEQEEKLGLLLEKLTGIRARAVLEGEHLNTCFGLIGAEQHLPRFPGDTVAQHDEFRQSGITPGRGAWGYFAKNRQSLTTDDVQKEKYYVAVQTLYLPDWEKRLSYLRDWYEHRKVLVLNPITGQAVVAVVADAGPAAWTGKNFGGSPEVMFHLGFQTGSRKGPVLLLFVDDPENKVLLGPVDYYNSKIKLPRVSVAGEAT